VKTAGLRHLSVAVLMGGWSGEREVSLRSGAAVLDALQRLGYRAWGVDAGPDLAARLADQRPDLAFVALHGRGGEDGAVQGMLEVLGIRYTGSGILASAAAMNKKAAKWLFERHGIRTPAWGAVRRPAPPVARLPVALPAVVKPVDEGSTLGVGLVREPEALGPALEAAWAFGPEALVEDFIPGREVTVGVLGRRPLPPVEIVPEHGLYDYEAKYRSAGTVYRVPAPASATLARELADLSVRAAEALGCRGAVRCDFRVDGETPFLLEVNTIPGMTATSLLPKAAAAAGMDFPELCDRIVRLAVTGGTPGAAAGS
jgi:D-alanine-D-alanine ligase